jgi:hydroxyacylglutathione hydrolase
MTRLFHKSTLLALLALAPSSALAQLTPGSMDVHWNEGAQDCKASPQPPLQVHAYTPQTFILRESLCATFEAPFLYLLIGSSKALLIDTGDVAGANEMPLAKR